MSASNDKEKSLNHKIKDANTARRIEHRFEQALGRFVIAWADAESELYRALVNYSQVSDAVARALFSGTRARSAISFIQSIAHNTSMAADRREDLDYVFAQMSAINTMRDHLVHHATDSYSYRDPNKRIIANTKASKYGNAFGYEIGPDTIEAMTQDLHAIANHLNMHWGRRTGQFRPWRENHQDDAPTPWLYKPPQPIDSWEQSPPDARKLLNQPKPSPKKC